MNSEDRMLRALKALRQADLEREAPRSVEDKLLASFRTRQREPWSGVQWSGVHWKLVAALAAAAMSAILLVRLRQETVRVDAVRNTAPVAAVVEQKPASSLKTATETPSRRRINPVVEEPPREIVSDFFPLMDVAPPLGRGELLRVSVPASAMRSVGLPVREERLDEPVQADVLIGEEGMVRAIRFVSQRY